MNRYVINVSSPSAGLALRRSVARKSLNRVAGVDFFYRLFRILLFFVVGFFIGECLDSRVFVLRVGAMSRFASFSRVIISESNYLQLCRRVFF